MGKGIVSPALCSTVNLILHSHNRSISVANFYKHESSENESEIYELAISIVTRLAEPHSQTIASLGFSQHKIRLDADIAPPKL